jgi:hypothetical protein
MTKRLVFVLFVIVASCICVPGVFAAEEPNSNSAVESNLNSLFAGKKLYKDLKYYAKLGDHRTATSVDSATAQWLKSRLKEAGFSVHMMPYFTNQFFPKTTSVTVNKHTKLEAFPVWWPQPTTAKGETGKITTDANNVSGKIFLFDNASGTVNQAVQTTIKTAAANGAIGVIVVLTSAATPSPEYYGQNAQQLLSYDPSADPGDGDQTPWKIPVVTVGRKDRPALQNAVDNQLDVKIISTGYTKISAISYVVVGTLERGDPSKTMIVSSPSSGWFDDAGERGSGIAIWLALAKWAAKDTSGVNWVFMSSSGHELNFRGTNQWLTSTLIPAPGDVYLWTHLGADVITYDYSQNADGTLSRMDQPVKQYIKYYTPSTPNQSIIDAMTNSFDPTVNAQANSLNILGLQKSITAGDLYYAKYRGYTSLLYFSGGNPTFHTRQDRPEISSPELLQPMALLIQATLQQVISSF